MSFSYTLIFVEGDTEFIFYKRTKEIYFPKAKSKAINLEGNFNINDKILSTTESHCNAHPTLRFSVLVCIDRESRSGKAPINMEMLKSELSKHKVLDVHLFEAIQDIECWFLHDIDGIYTFLKVPKNKRNAKKFTPVERFRHIDLSKLFKSHKKEYKKGNASQNFINNLDIDIIQKKSPELKKFIDLMRKR